MKPARPGAFALLVVAAVGWTLALIARLQDEQWFFAGCCVIALAATLLWAYRVWRGGQD